MQLETIEFNGSTGIPEDGDEFDRLLEEQKEEAESWREDDDDEDEEEDETACIHLDLVYGCWESRMDFSNCSKLLKSLVQSKYFQTHSKRIQCLRFWRFWFDDWKAFLEIFAKHQPKVFFFEFSHCHFTERGANILGWALENEKSGIHLEYLDVTKSRGSNAWISGLYKNTSIVEITTKELFSGLEFLDFMRQCPRRDQFEFIEYHGLLDKNETTPSTDRDDIGYPDFKSISRYWLRIQLYRRDQENLVDKSSRRCPLFLLMYYSWGHVNVNIEQQFSDEELAGKIDVYWNRFQHLLNFQDGQEPEKIEIKLVSEGKEILLQTVAAAHNKVPVSLDLMGCSLSEKDAQTLGGLLDSDTSGVNIESLNLENVKGSNAWMSALYKNKTLKALQMDSTDREIIMQLGRSLAGNTRIEEIRLYVRGSIDPSSVFGFLQSVCQMPLLSLLQMSFGAVWTQGVYMEPQADEDDEEEKQRIRQIHGNFKRCQQFIMKQVTERNIWIDLFSWMEDTDFTVMLNTLRKCKLLLRCDPNDFPDSLWANVFARVVVRDVLFCLLREMPRLCQKGCDHDEEEGS